jgi:hypothetical protein
MVKYAQIRAPGSRYTLNELYGWLANGGVTSRDRNTTNSAFCRYAPFYAAKLQRHLAKPMIEAFWEDVRVVVTVLLRNHYGHSKGTQMSKARISSETFDSNRLDVMLVLITEWLPICVDTAQDFTTLGDYAFYTFSKSFKNVLMYVDLKRVGIAECLTLQAYMPDRLIKAHIGYTYWQREPNCEPIAWLRKHNYITARSKQVTIDNYLDVWRRLSYCIANVPHTTLTNYSNKLTHIRGYTTNDEIDEYGEPLDDVNEVYTLC